MRYLCQIVLLGTLALPWPAFAAAQLETCVRRDDADPADFNLAFEKGPITLPAGTVFDWAGHTFGGAVDPLDGRHSIPGKAIGWRGVSKDEEARRGRLMVEDSRRDKRHSTGLVTLAEARLTKTRPCATIPVAAAASDAWGWTVVPAFGDPGIYFQAYGVMHNGALNTNWQNEAAPLGNAAIAGALNGVLHGTTEQAIQVPE